MTKRHFIALADAVRHHNKAHTGMSDYQFRPAHVEALADFCAAQNPRFDRALWLDYVNGECGPNGGKVRAA